ncbi:C-type lectin 1-like [Myxocyprinus asiaticus]|uniref:C-type lectin 1-like n=1 Tax=Myxocyprinus asiaticus TaxID=70543 RepID=UPI002221327E|nr:C-type lectin 1-like [Myxocyprinus asiaticus]
MKASSGLLIVLFGLTTALVREHIYVDIPKSWTDAQSYCRQNYEDLSTIQSEEEQVMLQKIAGNILNFTWIGLYREKTNTLDWMWSDGDSFSFSMWKSDQPDNRNGNQFCGSTMNEWYDRECSATFPFFCEKILSLVKKKMTWEEALEYCRANHTDLASMTSEIELQFVKSETVESETDSVWTGLHFLAGKWLWVNREHLRNQVSLPDCPAEPFRCGARNTKTDTWENRNCDEKLNFICN